MAHKTDRNDVFLAWERYRDLTGDVRARLECDNGFWFTEGARYRGLEAYGKATMLALLERFCDGWEAGRKVALEAMLAQKVPKGEYET